MSEAPQPWPQACDCHIHVYERGYPLAPTATFKPPHAPAAAYREVQSRLGMRRVVVVQPTGYGFDNSCTLAAVAQLGPDARAVAVIAHDTSDEELQRMHTAGVRGVRYMMVGKPLLGWETLDAMARRIAPLGWNINLQLDGRELPGHEAQLAALPCNLLIDHIGKFLGGMPPPAAALALLRRLLDSGRCWIKLSAPYESSRTGPPGYGDVAPLVREFATRWPERALWASNWPHPNVQPEPVNEDLLAWALALFGDERTSRRVLVDNPAVLYGF